LDACTTGKKYPIIAHNLYSEGMAEQEKEILPLNADVEFI
jgi:hypothetical protein